MNQRDLMRKIIQAEKAEEQWERRLFVAVNKVRLYRRRAKYYRAKLVEYQAVKNLDRVKRKIRIAGGL